MIHDAMLCHEIVAAVLKYCRDCCDEGAAGRGKFCDIKNCPLYWCSRGGRKDLLPDRNYAIAPTAEEVEEFRAYVCSVMLFCGVNVFRQWNIHPKYKEAIEDLNTVFEVSETK